MQSFLNRISIKGALTATLVLFAVLLVVMSALGYTGGVKGLTTVLEIDRVAVRQVDLVNQANIERLKIIVSADAYSEALRAKRFASEGDKGVKLQSMRVSSGSAREMYEAYREVPEGAPEKPLIDTLAGAFAPLLDLLDQQIQALEDGDLQGYARLNEQQASMASGYEDALRLYLNHNAEKMDGLLADYEDMHRMFSMIALGLLGAALAILIAVRYGLQRVIVQPLAEAAGHLQRLAKADLSQPIEIRSRNEVGQLLAAMRDMQESLARIVGSVREGSSSILVGAQQIAGGNADLSSRTEQQAASLEETAASMEQLTATVKQNADNARQASALANDASSTAGEGREVVGRVVETMQQITDSSQQIANIIGVIDSIAFQTNILALNASVEAARAGDQGRGFAVVAGEVRNLAGRCAEAAREIKALIEDSTRRVRDGSQLVDQAGKTIGEVVGAVRRVTDIIDEISAASQEQSAGIAQVNTAIAQMDEVTQQNAALVQEASAASASLADQAHNLEGAVEVFRLSGETSRQMAAPRADAGARGLPPRPPQVQAEAQRKRPVAAAEEQWESF
ncbi:Methyl-accepting chemotaxis protein I [compost metagenome]